MLVDVICVGDVWIWVGFWRRLEGSGFGSKIGESKVCQNGENIISPANQPALSSRKCAIKDFYPSLSIYKRTANRLPLYNSRDRPCYYF